MNPEIEKDAMRVGQYVISERERKEFDNITGDIIAAMSDCNQLKKLEAYMREEGLHPTAEAARCRLRALGSVDPLDASANPATAKEAQEALKASKADLKSWTASMSARAPKGAIPSSSSSRASDPIGPPVRSSGVLKVQPGETAVPRQAESRPEAPLPSMLKSAEDKNKKAQNDGPKQDSKFGGQVRSGKDYYHAWDKFADKAVADSDDEEGSASAVPLKASVPKPHNVAGAAAPPAPVAVRGPALTERLIAANAHLSREEKEFNANAEKIKGNEFFRAKEYAQAVEHYTVSLGFQPSNTSVRGNRAAAYIKLRMWNEAVADCDVALESDANNIKARVRRAAARMELGKAAEAMEDIDLALALDPINTELLSMRDKANKVLSRSTVRRIAIEEEDDDDESDPSASIETVAVTFPRSGGAAQRTKIVVVEESDDDDSEGGGDVPSLSAADKVLSPTSPLEPKSTAAVDAAASATTTASPEALVKPSLASAPDKLEKKFRIPVIEDDSSDSDSSDEKGNVVDKPSVSPSRPNLPSSEVPPPPYQPTPSPDQQSALLKDEGNRLFSQSDFLGATECYKRALALDPASALLYANMAISKLRAGDARGCLSDASVAISLDPKYHKAMHRRAMAKRSLGLLQAARDDLKIAHDLLPQGHKDRAALAEEMRVVITAMVEAEKKKKEAAKAAAASAASKKKIAHYKGGVTIEEEDEPSVGAAASDPVAGGMMTLSQLKKVEDGGAELAIKLRREAVAVKQQWEREEARRKDEWERAQVVVEQSPPHAEKPLKRDPPKAANGIADDATPPSSSTSSLAAPAPAPAPATAPHAAPLAMDSLRLRGNDLFKKGDSRGALELYEQCLQLDPSSVPVHANLALAKLNLGDPAGALSHCDAVLAAAGVEQATRVKAQHRRAQALRRLGRLEEALEAYKPVKQALAMHPQVDSEMSEIAGLIAAKLSEEASSEKAEEAALKSRLSAEAACRIESEAAARKAEADEAAIKADQAAREMAAVKREMAKAKAEEEEFRAATEAAARKLAEAKAEALRGEEKLAACRVAVDEAASKVAASPPDSSSADSPLASAPPPSLGEVAEREKALGNQLYGQGRLEDAASAYTRAIAVSPSSILFSNRALVMLKMLKPVAAESDCRAALALEPSAIKARHRLALALRDQGKLSASLAEYDAMLRSPSAPKETLAALRKERDALQALIRQQQSSSPQLPDPPAAASPSSSSQAPEEASQQPHARPSEPRRRTIAIEESNSSDDEGCSKPPSASAPSRIPAVPPSSVAQPPSAASPSPPPEDPSSPSSTKSPIPASSSGTRGQIAAATMAAEAIDKLSIKRPSTPRTALEFERACKLVSGSGEALVDLIKGVQPATYSAVFKDALNGAMVRHIGEALRLLVASDPEFAEAALRHLSEVSRFSMVVSMLGKADKAVLADVLTRLGSNEVDVSDLKAKYKVV